MIIGYLISSEKDYSGLICNDSGPQIAADYDLHLLKLESLADTPCDFVIVDPWITPDERETLARHEVLSRCTVFLTVTDPFLQPYVAEKASGSPSWVVFVEHMIEQGKAHLALTYSPSELTAYWFCRFPRTRLLHMPYVYDPVHERPLDHAARLNKLLLSGSTASSVYSLRRRMRRDCAIFPPLRMMTDVLQHPGYDRHQAKHATIADGYIDRLARYRFAGICSSTLHLEFLKYREFAYAGVVPVGDLPYSFADCPENAWIPWRRNPIKMWKGLVSAEDTEFRADLFRRYVREKRDIVKMRLNLLNQIRNIN